jgi:hypothetical protein
VVRVEVPDGNPRRAALPGGQGGNGDLVEITKPHRLPGGGVMTRRPHQCESLLVRPEGQFHRLHGGAHGAARMVVDPREIGCVVVEIGRHLQALQMRRRVGQEQNLLRGRHRQPPFPRGMRGAQVRHDLLHARRLFRTQRGAEVGALRVVKDDHLRPRKDTEMPKNQASEHGRRPPGAPRPMADVTTSVSE